jgi:hypothetical protein
MTKRDKPHTFKQFAREHIRILAHIRPTAVDEVIRKLLQGARVRSTI